MKLRAGILALGIVALTGCTASGIGSNSGGNPPLSVGVVGDSITYLSRTQVQTTVHPASLEAFPGADTAEIHAMARDELTKDPSINAWVINAGTNDVQRNIATWSADYTSFMADVQGAKCVVLTTIGTGVDRYGNGTVTAEEINTYLTAQVAAYPNFRLVDWNAAIAADPSLADVANQPGVHPTAAGSQWIADADEAALSSCP